METGYNNSVVFLKEYIMKKITALTLVVMMLALLCGCTSPSSLKRGQWDKELYYNEYGEFYLRSNELFDRYTDSKIKKNLGFVYSKDGQVLNDVVISSDYCAIIITLEKPGKEYSQEDYLDAFILNSRTANTPGSYSIGESYQQNIAGKYYAVVPILYYTGADNDLVGYCEYSFIRKTKDNVFVVIRITSTSQLNIEIALKMFEDPNGTDAEKPTASTPDP